MSVFFAEPASTWGLASHTNNLEKIQLGLLLVFFFFIPSSPAAPNAAGLLLMLLWLWEGRFAEKWQYLKSHPLFWGFCAYFLIYPLSLLWSDNQVWGMHILERHLIYLFFPFMLTALRLQYFRWYLTAFILGLTVTEATSYSVWLGWLQLEGVDSYNPTPFYHHTQYNPMLAWGLYLLLYGLLFQKNSHWIKILFFIFVITMTTNMFITGGRGGQLVFSLIFVLVILQWFAIKGRLWLGAVSGIALLGIILTLAYLYSPLFQSRANLAVQEFSQFSTDQCAGSVGSRLCFYVNTLKMFPQQPLLGSGIGDFPEDYSRFIGPNGAGIHLQPSTTNAHSHPHNQYLYELGALGLLGFIILMGILWSMFRLAISYKDPWQNYRYAWLVFVMAMMVSDSLLLAHSTGLLFLSFSALLFFRPIKATQVLS